MKEKNNTQDHNKKQNFLFLHICALPDLNYGSKILLNPSKINSTDLWITGIFSCRNPWLQFGHLYDRNKNHDTEENLTDHNYHIHQNVLKTLTDL